MPLNAKQERFVAEYLIDYNATQAAIRAGYSEQTAYSQGSRLLKHPEVHAAISTGSRVAVAENAGNAAWIVDKAVQVIEIALAQRRLGVIAPNLTILARRHPEFSEKHDITVDERARVLHLVAQLSDAQLLQLAGPDDDVVEAEDGE